MKKLSKIFCLLTLFSSIALLQENNNEFRAVWVITWEHINPYSSTETNKARVRKILDNIKKANMNAVLWQARQSGTAYYNSSYEPWGYYAGYENPGYDPLQYTIEEAHKRGIEVHAWFNVFHCSSTHPGAPAAEHPEWICRDGYGNPMPASRCLSPGLKEVRDYLVDVAMEIVNNYDIDGLHLDFIRWNEYTTSNIGSNLAKLADENRLLDGMITKEMAEELRRTDYSNRYLFDIEHPYSGGVPEGFSSWEEWWRWCVTEYVRTLHDSIQKVKPWVRLSVAALGRYNWGVWNGYHDVFQDAALWFNKGYIEQLTPMHYHWTTPDDFYKMLEGNCPHCWKYWIQEGIEAGRLYTVGPGSYILKENNVWYRHPQIVETCREVDWTDGFQFFSYGSWNAYDYWETAGNTFFSKLTKIRATKLIDDIPPDPPQLLIQKTDSLHYKITVQVPDTLSCSQWITVYRMEHSSGGNSLDPNHDPICLRAFSDTNITFEEEFTGLQDFNGKYCYYATLIDRYWNESEPSNTVITDSIPSFAPTVISHFPADGDTVDINIDIRISFSKTMDTSSVVNSITITPEKEYLIIWSEDRKSLTIDFPELLDYAQKYTVIISQEARDVNGKKLDGNADGIPGDSYSFTFTTNDVDIYGPVLISSHPNFRNPKKFDIEDVINIEFNEIIDESFASSDFISLKNYRGPLDVDLHHNIINGKRSLISLRPYEALIPFLNYEIHISATITDTLGNPMGNGITINFKTKSIQYDEIKNIDNFSLPGAWWQPDGSGSTIGIDASKTRFGFTSTYYLPGSASRPIHKRGAYLKYKWKESADSYLIREYLPAGDPKQLEFDTTYTLQFFVFGDGSKNKFRFAIDEAHGSSYTAHEVSKWVTIDWYGWKLIEWELSNPDTVGSWDVAGNNGILDGDKYRFDSFQITKTADGSFEGTLYFDELRIAKKSVFTGIETQEESNIASKVKLYQNYPNPFNSSTTITFELPSEKVVSLVIYDLRGREVCKLLNNRKLQQGQYKVRFNSYTLTSGEYIYVLKSGSETVSRKMVIIK